MIIPHINNISYFAYLGTIYLIVLCWQDYKNNMKLDDRLNFFMLGISISLLSHIKHGFFYMVLLLLSIFVVNMFMRKFKIFGIGDINALSWLFLGLGIIHIWALAYFYFIFVALSFLYYAIKYWLFRYKQPTPFIPVILLSFVCSAFLLGLYF